MYTKCARYFEANPAKVYESRGTRITCSPVPQTYKLCPGHRQINFNFDAVQVININNLSDSVHCDTHHFPHGISRATQSDT